MYEALFAPNITEEQSSAASIILVRFVADIYEGIKAGDFTLLEKYCELFIFFCSHLLSFILDKHGKDKDERQFFWLLAIVIHLKSLRPLTSKDAHALQEKTNGNFREDLVYGHLSTFTVLQIVQRRNLMPGKAAFKPENARWVQDAFAKQWAYMHTLRGAWDHDERLYTEPVVHLPNERIMQKFHPFRTNLFVDDPSTEPTLDRPVSLPDVSHARDLEYADLPPVCVTGLENVWTTPSDAMSRTALGERRKGHLKDLQRRPGEANVEVAARSLGPRKRNRFLRQAEVQKNRALDKTLS